MVVHRLAKVVQPVRQAASARTGFQPSQPPLANRGVETTDTEQTGVFDPLSVGEPFGVTLDYLTVTVPESGASALLSETQFEEPGKSGRGFRQSERRLCTGGDCWRRWEPVSPSAAWGLSYESWEFSGPQAYPSADRLRARECRPSRVDVCWNFSVPEELTACVFAEPLTLRAQERGIEPGVSGHNNINTRYIGSINSDRRIRIYRKDKRDEAWLIDRGPVLRVELVLKGARALAWWAVWCRSQSDAYAAAAAHLVDMVGWSPVGEVGIMPPVLPSPTVDAAQAVFHFMRQHGSELASLQDAGVDIFGLLGAARERWSRATISKQKKRTLALQAAGPSDVEALVYKLFGMVLDA